MNKYTFSVSRCGILLMLACCVFTQTIIAQSPTNLRKNFLSPPESASPWVFWYWNYASVSKEGITADLKAMKEAGIGGAYLMPIKGAANPPLMDSSIVQLTPAWWNMIRFSLQEAKRFNIKLGFHVSDGFALAGGPWITPELSMQKLVWSQKNIAGGKLFNDTLPQPETLEGYYKDIAVFAFPSLAGAGVSTNNIKPIVTSSKPDSIVHLLADANNKRTVGCDEQCWIQYEFEKPFTCRTIVIRSRNNYQSNRLMVEVSNDGKTFRSIGRLEPPRHGWQDWDANYTHSIPPVTAKYFRFVFDKTGTEPGAEDLDAAKWRPSLRLTGIELSAEPRIHHYEGKNGEVWRISKHTTDQQIPDSLCVPSEDIIDLTNKLDKNGRLTWDAPQGIWTILRIGHTSTGHRNATGGGGQGLECDKFNPAAVQLQFNNWFGEIVRQAGSAKDVIKMFHVDSWECGSQNWSSNFKEIFLQKRRYDLMRYLPVMAGIPVDDAATSESFLHDVRTTIAELVNDSFYTTLYKLANNMGTGFSAESVAPTMLSDGMLHYKSVDVPMGEFWLRSPTHDKPNDMLDAISAAHIYGKQIVQAEGFTQLRMAWDEYPGMLKALGDRNFALGINKLFYHVFMHNPWMDRKPGMTLDAIGLYFQRDQTWWKQSRGWIDYVKRCQALLQFGWPVADIAVFAGEELPRRSVLPDRLVPVLPGIFGKEIVEREKLRLANIGQPQRQLPAGVNHSANMADPENWINPLNGYAYDSFNSDAFLYNAKYKKGGVQFNPNATYRLLIFPGSSSMSPNGNKISVEVAEQIKKLADQGAKILMRDPPEKLFSVVDTRNHGELMPNIFESVKEKIISGAYHDSSFVKLGIQPDVIIKEAGKQKADGIAWTHRTGENVDLYFISNQHNTARQIELSLRINGKIPEIWDPLTGSIINAATWRVIKGRTIVPIQLEANGALFIVFQQPTKLQQSNQGKNWIITEKVQSITTPWTVQFNKAYGGREQPVIFETLSDWSQHTDTAIRYYSGTASYSTTINWNGTNNSTKPVFLNIGEVANIAEVFVNGVSCGIAWTAPYRVNITKALKPGKNAITIDVSNTWANRLIGDRRLPEDKRITNTIAPYRLEGKPLLPAGLLGPVVIEKAK